MNKAVFLDRDGVINELLFNDATKEYEPPSKVFEIKLFDGVLKALKLLQEDGFKLFLVSNQPDFAKGKTTLEVLEDVHKGIAEIFTSNNIKFSEFYYCYHHPNGIEPEFSIDCDCRKPKTYFVTKAAEEFSINRSQSWFVGDRDLDIICGQSAGLQTILIENNYYQRHSTYNADHVASGLLQASEIILNKK